MTTEQAIFEKVRELSSEKQQDVLAFIEYLNTDEWQQRYQRRFRQLQWEVQVGIEAADRGDVIEADVMFQDLRNKLQQKRAQVGQ
jgi:ABC-type Fe3+ transport system substrate-binding protein